MNNNIKDIPRPDFESAVRLTPLQLNAFRCQKKHTLLTPERLKRIAKSSSGNKSKRFSSFIHKESVCKRHCFRKCCRLSFYCDK